MKIQNMQRKTLHSRPFYLDLRYYLSVFPLIWRRNLPHILKNVGVYCKLYLKKQVQAFIYLSSFTTYNSQLSLSYVMSINPAFVVEI